MFHHIYIAPDRGRQSIGDKILKTIERPFLFALMLQVLKWSLRNLILYTFLMILYMYIAPGQGQKTPWGQQKALITSTICCRFQTNLFEFWFYTHFLMFFHMYISLGQGGPFVDKILMSTEKPCHIAHLLQVSKKYLWSLILYIIFHDFKYAYSPGEGADNPLGSDFLYKHKPFVTLLICCKFLPLNDFLTVFPI